VTICHWVERSWIYGYAGLFTHRSRG
jgi:hypothetical protein